MHWEKLRTFLVLIIANIYSRTPQIRPGHTGSISRFHGFLAKRFLQVCVNFVPRLSPSTRSRTNARCTRQRRSCRTRSACWSIWTARAWPSCAPCRNRTARSRTCSPPSSSSVSNTPAIFPYLSSVCMCLATRMYVWARHVSSVYFVRVLACVCVSGACVRARNTRVRVCSLVTPCVRCLPVKSPTSDLTWNKGAKRLMANLDRCAFSPIRILRYTLKRTTVMAINH